MGKCKYYWMLLLKVLKLGLVYYMKYLTPKKDFQMSIHFYHIIT